MSNPVILFIHFIATLDRLLGPGGVRSIVAESPILTAPHVLSSDTLPPLRFHWSMTQESLTYCQDVFGFSVCCKLLVTNEIGRGERI